VARPRAGARRSRSCSSSGRPFAFLGGAHYPILCGIDTDLTVYEVNRAHAQGANGRLPTGSTLLKQRQLGQLRVVSVPYWKWIAVRRDKDQEQAYLSKALAVCVPSQAPRKAQREAKREVVPETEVDKEVKDASLDERLSSVDWDDDTALKKLTNEVLKLYLKRLNLRSSGLNKARAQLLRGLFVSKCTTQLLALRILPP